MTSPSTPPRTTAVDLRPQEKVVSDNLGHFNLSELKTQRESQELAVNDAQGTLSTYLLSTETLGSKSGANVLNGLNNRYARSKDSSRRAAEATRNTRAAEARYKAVSAAEEFYSKKEIAEAKKAATEAKQAEEKAKAVANQARQEESIAREEAQSLVEAKLEEERAKKVRLEEEIRSKRAEEAAAEAALQDQIDQKVSELKLVGDGIDKLETIRSQLLELFSAQDTLANIEQRLAGEVLRTSRFEVEAALGAAALRATALGAANIELFPTPFSKTAAEAERLGSLATLSCEGRNAIDASIDRLMDEIEILPQGSMERIIAERALEERRIKLGMIERGEVPKGMEPVSFFNDAELERRRDGSFKPKVTRAYRRGYQSSQTHLARHNRNRPGRQHPDIYRSHNPFRRALRPDVAGDSRSAHGALSRVGQVINLTTNTRGDLIEVDGTGIHGRYIISDAKEIMFETNNGDAAKPVKVKYVKLTRVYSKKVAKALHKGGGDVSTVEDAVWVPLESLSMHLSGSGQLRNVSDYAANHVLKNEMNKRRRNRTLKNGVVFERSQNDTTLQPVTPRRWGTDQDIAQGVAARDAQNSAVRAAKLAGRDRNRLRR